MQTNFYMYKNYFTQFPIRFKKSISYFSRFLINRLFLVHPVIFIGKIFFAYYIVEIDHYYHTVPFIFSEIDKLTFSFIYAIFQYYFCQFIDFHSVGGDLKHA